LKREKTGKGGRLAENDEHPHEHAYVPIVSAEPLSAYEEAVHRVITIEFLDRGLSLNLDYDEALQLAAVTQQIAEYIQRRQQPGHA